MARADLLINLVKAGASGNQQLFRKTVEAMAAEARAKQHHQLADRLAENLRSLEPPDRPAVLRLVDNGSQNLLFEIAPARNVGDLVLSGTIRDACEELIQEHHRTDVLRSYGLEPRRRLLLVGPPGNGKTSLAEAIAFGLMRPLFVVRYEGIIASFLGETASRLTRLFDHIRTRPCVLFFDEFDAIGKERGDVHETGEIKRVVSSLLMQIDSLPSHVLVVTATNHPELLDRAVWRRFQMRLTLGAPNLEQAEDWFRKFQVRFQVPLPYSPAVLAKRLRARSFADLEEFCLDVHRRYVLALPDPDLKSIVASRLRQWESRYSPGKAKR